MGKVRAGDVILLSRYTYTGTEYGDQYCYEDIVAGTVSYTSNGNHMMVNGDQGLTREDDSLWYLEDGSSAQYTVPR